MIAYHTHVLEHSPKAYWRLGEASGDFADSSGNSHTGTPGGGITYGVVGALVVPNRAIILNGSSGFVSATDHADLDLGDGPLTIEAWVKKAAHGSSMAIVAKGVNAYQLRYSAANKLQFVKENVSNIVSSTVTILDTAWHHVAVTKNGAASLLYIDGVDVTDTVTDATLADTATDLYVGRRGGAADEWFNGSVDEVAIYDTVLSAAEILAHYEAGASAAFGPGAVIKFHDPHPPHRVLGTAFAVENSLSYGFVANRASRAAFQISRGDALVTDNPDAFALGNMVTLERTDGKLPWVGYVTQTDVDLADPAASFVCTDWAGQLFEGARTAFGWPEETLASGEWIKRVHADADARGEPPLPCLLDVESGPPVPYSPKMESFLTFLRDMAKRAGWEWAMFYSVGHTVRVTLKWTGTIGIDRSGEVTFSEGRHFKRARITRSAEGHISAAVAVGGSGTFSSREAAQVNALGRADPGIAAQAAGEAKAPSSPALAGTRVLVEPGATTEEARLATARSTFTSPDYVKERLTLDLVESTIDMSKIELGSSYTVKFTNLDLGLGYERVVRVVAIDLNESGVIGLIVEVR